MNIKATHQICNYFYGNGCILQVELVSREFAINHYVWNFFSHQYMCK